MVNTTASLKNVNLLSKEQFDAISSPATDELWAVETPTIVESYYTTSNWYRVYSDGWVEQGGKINLNGTITATNKIITFLKPMYNTGYFRIAANNANVGDYRVTVGWETTTSMSIGVQSGSTTGQTTWLVIGRGA